MLSRLFKRSPNLQSVTVEFISKDDCHLCDVALGVVEEVRRKNPFQLTVIKIAPGDEWYEQYWDKIPVILINGRIAFKYRVDPTEFTNKLWASVQVSN